MDSSTATLLSLFDLGEARRFPKMNPRASTRRWALLVRAGTIPPGVVVRFGKRIFIDLARLDSWIANGGTAARPAEPEREPVAGGAS